MRYEDLVRCLVRWDDQKDMYLAAHVGYLEDFTLMATKQADYLSLLLVENTIIRRCVTVYYKENTPIFIKLNGDNWWLECAYWLVLQPNTWYEKECNHVG